MEINILFDNAFEGCVPEKWLRDIAGQVLSCEGKNDIEMGILVTGQERMQELNNQYLKEDHPTDVLSFSMLESIEGEGINFPVPPDKLQHLGEVIISYPQALKQAEEHNHPIKTEMATLLIHGILHLLGYDHDMATSEARMKTRERVIFNLVSAEIL
jgi:probable rRNA maturation factor